MRPLIRCAAMAALLAMQIPDSQGMTQGLPAPEPSEAPVLPSATPGPPLQQFKEPLWSVEEGFFVSTGRVNNRLIIIWRAEKSIQETTVTRFSGPQQAEVKIIPITESIEKELRQRVGKLAIQLPSRASNTDKSKCSHWMEIETLYGKRFFCEGDEAPGAFDFLKDLHELAGN